jgi:hypothetical protein
MRIRDKHPDPNFPSRIPDQKGPESGSATLEKHLNGALFVRVRVLIGFHICKKN